MKKVYLTDLKRATINNSGSNLMQHASHRNCWNLSMKVGGAAQRKFGAILHIGGMHNMTLKGQCYAIVLLL